jgi:hypothetical protein
MRACFGIVISHKNISHRNQISRRLPIHAIYGQNALIGSARFSLMASIVTKNCTFDFVAQNYFHLGECVAGRGAGRGGGPVGKLSTILLQS